MALRPQPRNCDRARAWVSLRLDDEISELEEAMLDAHLRQCAACRDFEATVRGAVLQLRAQPLEQIRHPVVVSGRRRLHVRPASVARVAAVAAAVVGVTTVLTTQTAKGPASVPTPNPGQPILAVEDNDQQQLRTLRVLQLGGRPPRGSGVGSFGPVTSRILGPAN